MKMYGDARLDLEWMQKYKAHNGYELEALFDVRIPACSRRKRERIGDVTDTLFGRARRRLGLSKRSQYGRETFGFDPAALSPRASTYFAGYWQSYRYYEGREESIRDAFRFTAPLKDRDREFLDSLRGRATIGVHVRRGDSLRNPMVDGVCGDRYYKEAISAVLKDARDPILVFFSDDLDWCRDRRSSLGESVYIDWNKGADSHADMRLMSLCDALVIANSSFSWWGAWLGAKGRTIAAPKRWFASGYEDNLDIVPPDWLRF